MSASASNFEEDRKIPLKTKIDQLNFLFQILPGLSKGYQDKDKKRWWEEQPKKQFKIGLIRSHDLDTEFTVINETFDVAKSVKGNSTTKPLLPDSPAETKNAGFNTQNNIQEKELNIKPEMFLTAKDFDRLYLGWVDENPSDKEKKIIKSTMKQLFRYIFGKRKIYEINDFHTRLIISYTTLEPVEKIPCESYNPKNLIQRKLREHLRNSLQFRLDLVVKEILAGTSTLGEQAFYVDDKKDLATGLRDIINALDDKEAACIQYGDDPAMIPDTVKETISGDYDRLLRIFKTLLLDRQKENPSFPSYEDFQTHLVKGDLTNTKKGKELYEELLGLLDRATMKHAEELEHWIVVLSELIQLANEQHILHIELERLRCKKEKEPEDDKAAAKIKEQLEAIQAKAAAAVSAGGLTDDSLQGLLNRLALFLSDKPFTPDGGEQDTLESLLAALKTVAPSNAGIQTQIGVLQDRLAKSDAEVQSLRGQLAAAQQYTEGLRGQLAAAQARPPEAQLITPEDLGRLKADLERLTQELADARAEAAARPQAEPQEIARLTGEVSTLQGQLAAAAAAQQQAVAAAVAEAEGRAAAAQQELAALQQTAGATAAELEAAQLALEASRDKLQAHRQQQDAAIAAGIAAATARAEAAEAEVDRLQRAAGADPLALAAAQRDLQAAQLALQQEKATREAIIAERIAAATARATQAEEALAAIQAQGRNVDEARAALEAAQSDLVAVRQELQQQRDAQAAATQRVVQAEEALAEASRERDEARAAAAAAAAARRRVEEAALEADAAHRQLEAASAADRARLQVALTQKEEELRAAQAALAAAEATLQQERSDAAAALEAARSVAQQQATELQTQAQAAQAESARTIAELRAQLAASQAEKEGVRERLERSIEETLGLQEQIAALEIRIRALSLELQNPRQEDLDTIARQQAQIADLQRQLEDLRRLLAARTGPGAPSAAVPSGIPGGVPPPPPPGKPEYLPSLSIRGFAEKVLGPKKSLAWFMAQDEFKGMKRNDPEKIIREIIAYIQKYIPTFEPYEPSSFTDINMKLATYLFELFSRMSIIAKARGQSIDTSLFGVLSGAINSSLLPLYTKYIEGPSEVASSRPSSAPGIYPTAVKLREEKGTPSPGLSSGVLGKGQSGRFSGSFPQGGGARETPLLSQDSFCETMLTLLLLHIQNTQGESFDLQSFLDKAAATLDDLGQCPLVLHTLNKLLDDSLKNTKSSEKGFYFNQLKNSPQEELQAIEKAYNNRFTEEEQDALESFTPQILFSRPPEPYTDVLGSSPYMLIVNSLEDEETPLLGLDEDPEDPVVLDAKERDMLTTGGISLGGLLFLYLNCLRQLQESGNQINLNSKCPALLPKRTKDMAKTPKAKSPRKRKLKVKQKSE